MGFFFREITSQRTFSEIDNEQNGKKFAEEKSKSL